MRLNIAGPENSDLALAFCLCDIQNYV